VMMGQGMALKLLVREMTATINQASSMKSLEAYVSKFGATLKSLQETTQHLVQVAMNDKPEVFLSDATLYLEYFGIVTVAWLWLKQGLVAQLALDNGAAGDDFNFYQGKVHTMKYYYEYEVPKIQALRDRLESADKVTLDLKSEYLN